MKSIFLHGAIGEAFGKEFKLDVSTPREALRALLAINADMKKYLMDTQKIKRKIITKKKTKI